jgi:anaerobic magnesium-protoporphyrin IX monomethyl ester cyclase
MLQILVAHSYFLRLDPKQAERAKPYPPLATLQVAATLRRAGHRIALFDAMLALGLDEYVASLEDAAPELVLIYEDNFNFLTKMCLARMRSAACEMTRAAHCRGARVIIGGSDATDDPTPYLRSGADVVLRGEGLAALEQLVARLDARPEISAEELTEGIAGVACLGRDCTVRVSASTFPREAPPPPAAWDLVDMERYRRVWLGAHGFFSLNLAASRGCSFRCAWCAKPIWGNRYLQRDAAEVASEVAHLKRSFAPDHLWFADDIFGFRVDWVAEFAAALHAAGGSVPFTIQTRADLVSERMAATLSDAGCTEAWLGAESGSQEVLDAMNKGVRVEQIFAARSRLAEHRIRVGFFIQLGYPGEQLQDILATRDLITRACPDDVGVSVAYPLPGTKFHELVKAQLGPKTRWQDSNDLAMMFRGTYTSDFYRTVRDLLHAEVHLRRGPDATTPGVGLEHADALASRWDSLIAGESQFRNAADEAFSCAHPGTMT